MDLEEFTSDTSGNAYSAVAAIVDAFYGNTDLVWTDVPSSYSFGVFYDGMNAMGGMYQPRHALTYDDAGGLKYMYETNTVVMEFNPYTLTIPADYTYWLRGIRNWANTKVRCCPQGLSCTTAARAFPCPECCRFAGTIFLYASVSSVWQSGGK